MEAMLSQMWPITGTTMNILLMAKEMTHAMTSAILQPSNGSRCDIGRIQRVAVHSLPDEVTKSSGITKVVQICINT